jgi:hypothetical protein
MPDAAYVERDGTIATLILNRPERNVLDLSRKTSDGAGPAGIEAAGGTRKQASQDCG